MYVCEDENMITFVHTYNPHHPNIFRVVQVSRSILEGSPVIKELIDNTRLSITKLPESGDLWGNITEFGVA